MSHHSIRVTTILACALLATGCITVDRHDTVYLAADGSLAWQVIERDIRSTHEDTNARAKEEREYIGSFRAGEHQIPLALARLGGYDVRSDLVRAERPYMIVSEAKFANLETLGWELVKSTGMLGTSELVQLEDGSQRFALTIYHPGKGVETKGDEVALSGTVAWVSGLRVVLQDGEFKDAVGFQLDEGDESVATVPDDYIKHMGPAGSERIELSLTWKP